MGGFWLSIHGSPYQPRAVDLVGCLKGRFVGIELKRPGAEATAHQAHTMSQIIESGGIAGKVFSKKSLKRLLYPLTNSAKSDKVEGGQGNRIAVSKQSSLKEATRKMAKNKKVQEPEEEEKEEDEDELEDLDDLGDEEEDEAPKAKRTRSAKTKKAKAEKEGIGPSEIAEEAGVTAATVRRFLRANPDLVEGHEHQARYTWPSLESRQVQRILKGLEKQAQASAEPEEKPKAKAKKGKAKRSKK